MPMFVVQRELPGITPEALQNAGARSKSCCAEMSHEGKPVRWLRSFFLPASSQAYCYYESADASVVEEVNKRAQIPFVAVTGVIEMTPDAV